MDYNYNIYPYYFQKYYDEDKQIALEQVSTPSGSAVSLEETKAFIREDRDIENDLIEGLIEASENSIRDYLGYHFIDTDFKLHLSKFEDVRIPKQPYKSGSVVVKYDDEDGVEQTLSTDKYSVYEQETPVRIDFLSGLPDVYDNESQDYPVRVEFTIGYGADDSAVPHNFKTAIKVMAMIFHKREIPMDADTNINPLDIQLVKSLIFNHQIGRFH